MRQSLLVHNPHAGLEGRGCSPRAIELAMGQWGWAVERLPCASDRTIEQVRAAVARGCERVVVAGGDGTIHLVANALAGTDVPLGVVPCGTANDFARSIGLPPTLEAALEVVRAGHCERLDLGWVNGRYFLNVASLGLSAEIARDLSPARKRRWGRWAYLMETASRLRSRQAVPLQVCLGSACDQIAAYQVTIANGCCFGGGFRVSREASFEDGRLDVVLVEAGLRNLVRSAAAPGKTLLERIGSRIYRVDHLTVMGSGRMLLNLDGESLWLRSPLNFKVVPRSLSVCMGRP